MNGHLELGEKPEMITGPHVVLVLIWRANQSEAFTLPIIKRWSATFGAPSAPSYVPCSVAVAIALRCVSRGIGSG
jgi:hypothetical protein